MEMTDVRTKQRILSIVAGLLLCLTAATPASACPMCKLANESDSRLPQAYMYSILFMMGMPAAIFSGFSVGFWRLSRKAARLQLQEAEIAVAGADDPIVEATTERQPRFAPDRGPGDTSLPGPGFVFP
jgi:hypothetical protein